jgi:hypothetical protein
MIAGQYLGSVITRRRREGRTLGLDGDSLGVDSSQVGVLDCDEQTLFNTSQLPALERNPSDRRRAVLTKGDQVGLASLLQRSDSGRLESEVSLEVLGNLSDETLEGELPDQEFGGFLRPAGEKEIAKGKKARESAKTVLNQARVIRPRIKAGR